MDRYIQKMLAPLKRRVLNMVNRCVVKTVNNLQGLQLLQVSALADELHDGVERFQQYGFSSYPPLGSQAVVLFWGGEKSHPMAMAVEDPAKRKAAISNVESVTDLAVQPEDVLLYNSNTSFVLLRADSGNIIIHSPETIRLDAKDIELHASNSIKWDVDGRGYTYYDDHTDTWENCTVSGTSHDCASPEHPGDPAQ